MLDEFMAIVLYFQHIYLTTWPLRRRCSSDVDKPGLGLGLREQ